MKTFSLLTCLLFCFNILWPQPVQDLPEFRTRVEEGCHTSGIYLATKRIQNQPDNEEWTVKVCAGDTTVFHAPEVILRPGFLAEKGSVFLAGVPTIDLHFVVVDPNATYGPGGLALTVTDLHAQTERLNRYFYAEDDRQLIRFQYKSTTTWADIVSAGLQGDDLIHYITSDQHCYRASFDVDCDGDGIPEPANQGDCDCDGIQDNYGSLIQSQFLATPHGLLRDHHAINVYIYNNAHVDMLPGNTGHGRSIPDGDFRGTFPYILIDYDRFSGNPASFDTWGYPVPIFRPVDHELGHAFGLNHTFFEQLTSNTQDSNIMGTPNFTDPCGSLTVQAMGNRMLGFAYEPYIDCTTIGLRKDQEPLQDYGQVETILWVAEALALHFGSDYCWSTTFPIRLPCGSGTCSYFPY